jgi:hypothetical protein
MTHSRTLAFVGVLGLMAQAMGAQQPNASAGAFGMAGNYTAVANGYDAVAWNPAMLGINAPKFSLSILSGAGSTGLDPVKLTDITKFYGLRIDDATKNAWLNSIGTGMEHGSADAGLSLLALSIGHLGFQAGVTGTGNANLNQDAAEAILFGNAGRNNGTAKNLSFSGSNASGSVFATGAVSIALPLPIHPTGRPDEQFSLGVTGKYIRSLFVARAMDNGSLVTVNNINVQFPIIHTPIPDSTSSLSDLWNKNGGSGYGVDVGLAWSAGGTTISATARNVVNTFAWKTTGLKAVLGTATFDGTNNAGSNVANFGDTTYSLAPASMRAALEAEKFQPEIAGGISHRTSKLLLSADVSQRLGDATIDAGPQSHVGVGAELTLIPFLPIRGGFAVVSGGYEAAGGAGLRLGPLEVSAAVSLRTRNGGSEYGAMVSAFSIH